MITPQEFLELRIASGMNQTEFGKSIGVCQEAVSCYELGTRSIPKRLWLWLAEDVENLRWQNEVIAKAAMSQAIQQYFQV